jgi:putative two-component system hydrogenase maturation factor HypX/HoxX
MLALAADQVWCRAGAVLNPHYRLLGLHGSEYWTYTLPRRVGAQEAARLTQACLPVSAASALRSGLVDQVIMGGAAGFRAQVADLAEKLAWSPDYAPRLAARARELAAAQKTQPLDAYRKAELAMMRRNFFDPRQPYTALRRAFVYKEKPAQTPPHLTGRQIHPGPSHPEQSQGQEMIAAVYR